MKKFNYFNNLFSRVKEHSSPTVNRRSTDGQSQRQYSIGIWKYVAMIALLLTLACGQANAWYYITGDPVGGWAYDAPAGGKMNSSNNITFMAMAAGTYYFRLYCDGWGSPCGSINSASGTAYDSSGKQSGDCGAMWVKTNDVANITFQVVNSDQVNITVTKCAYYIKYKWNNGSAAWSGDMKSNGDGTYSVMGQYGGNKFRYGRKDSDGGADYSDSDQTATVVGSPSNGNWCIFTYTPASHSLEIRKCNSITKTNHIYFDNENAKWTPTYLYFVIGRPYKESDKYSKMYRIQQITNTKLWYVANSADNWSDAGYYAIAGGGSAWDNGTNWNYDALSGWTNHSAPYLGKFDMANGDIVAVTKADNTIGGAISMTKRGTSGSLNSALNNLTITYKYSLSRDGGSTYSDMTSDMCKTPCSLQMDWYKFSNCSTATKQTAKTTSANGTSYTNNTGSNAGYRAAITMTHGTPVATGYTFVCWHDGTNSLGTSNPFTFYPAATMTVEARFKANAYSVKFNKNDDGATGTMSNQTHYYGTSKALTSCGFTAPSGKVFAGWATSPSGPVVYSNGESVTNLSSTDGATVNLYAVWAYSLTYNCDGADIGCPSNGGASALPNPLPTPVKYGYNFDGWFTNSGKTTPAVAGATLAASTTLYAKWTKVYAIGTYQFDGHKTVGTSPSYAVTTSEVDYVARRADNIFFSATRIQFEGTDGTPTGDGDDFKGWKIKASTTIKFYVENNSDVEVSIGSIGGGTCTISYTDQSSVAHNNTSISAGTHPSFEVKAGTMVTISVAPSSDKSITLKRIAISGSASCTTPTIAWSTSPTNGNVGGNMTISVTSNYPAGVSITSNNSNATLSGRTVDGSTVSYTLNYAVAGNANITASVDGDGSTVCDETVNLDAVAITISKNTPTSYTVSGGGSYCPGQGQVCLDDSQDDISYQLYRGESKVGEAMEGSRSGICWLNLSEAGTYTVKAVENATYAAATMSGNAVITFKTNTAIETQPSSVAHANVGSAASLSGLLATGTSLSYQWQTCNSDGTGAVDINTGTNPSAATATLSITPASAGVTYYKCVVSGGCGALVTSNVVSITAKNTISPTLSYASTSIVVGDVTAAPTVSGNTGSGSVSYSSNATDVATVASDGKVTAKTVGSATITATIAETSDYWGNTATATFTIGKGSISPSLSYASVGGTTLAVGATSTGSPTVSGNTGDGTVTYSVSASSPSGCATVNSETGVVTAVHPGTATITASIAATTNYNAGSATASFTITKANISPTLSYASTSLVVGDETDEPTVDGNPGSGTVTYEVTSASPSGCITVDEDGKVTAVKAGSATVTATIAATTDYNGNTATADFTISACSPTTLASMTITGTSTATATVGTAAVSLGEKDKSDGYKLGSNGHYARVTISSGYLQQGDVLSVEVTTKPDGNKLYIYKYVSDTWTQLGEVAASSAGLYTYTLTAENVTSDFDCIGLYRTGGNQNPFVKSMTVTRPCAATTYSVTYADGGATDGDVPEDDNTYDEGDEVTVLGNTGSLEKDGYTFGGWSANVDLIIDEATVTTGTPIAAGNTFSMPAEDVTLTAVWNPEDYTITYHLNGASWAGGYSAPANYTVGTGETLPGAGNMTNTGYTFGGWYDNSSLTGSAVTNISTSDYGNKTFWAEWTENTYTITYNANGDGAGNVGDATGSTSSTNGHYVTVASCGFELDGYLFTGWNTANNGSGESYGAGEDIELTADMTLYAQWATDYTITWGNVQIGGAGLTVKPNLGGGNYTITANTGSWTGSLDASMISSETSGVTITNVAVSNGGSPKTITVTFAVGAEVVGESIGLTLSVPAAGVYSAKSDTHPIAIDRCTGSGGGSDGVLFSAEFKDSGLGTSNICDAANTAYTFTTAELKSAATGGSIKAFTTDALNHMKFATNAISIAGSDGVIQIDLSSPLATNDLFTYYNVNSSTSAAYLRHTSPTNTTDQIALTVYNKETKVRLTSGFDGKSTLYIVRNNNDFKLHKAAVVRPAFLMLLRDDDPTSDTNLSGTNVELTTSTYLTTIQGGHAYFTSPSSGNLKIKRSSSKNYINFNSQAGYVKIVLDEALQEGDIIGFDSYNTNNLALTTTDVRSTSIVTTSQLYTVGESSPLKNQTTFYFWQYSGSSDYLRGLQIARSGAAGGGGGTDKITTTLSWDPALNTDPDWDSGNNRLNKETGDADFTFAAVQDKNSLGVLTYSSSNTGVATVTAGGTVHIVGAAGDATITATMAESGCYKGATISYNIHVVDNCDDTPGHVMAYDLGCEGTRLFVVLYDGMNPEAVNYQWYKDGASLGEEYRAQQCTVRVAGEYYVIVDNTEAGARHCAMASDNTVVVEARDGISAEKIVDQWYVKNGRRTPDIELVQTTGATGFIVKIGETPIWNSDGTVTTGFGGCGFHLGENGIIYLNGTKDNGDAPSDLTGDADVTLKITAEGCGGNASELSITIHCQAATTRKSVAFVVDGTEKGRFDQPNADHSTNSALYQFLDNTLSGGSGQFDLTAQNIYSTVNEKELREHYSQFDAIIITDDPSTDKKKDGKSYVNAFGTMIDVRPILTMEAFVSKLANWKAKGINGNPESPSPRQYAMKLQCKDHEIFNGLSVGPNVNTETIDEVDYWTVTMVDKTKSPYSSMVSDTDDTKGTPALQGFSASDVSGLLLLGEIKNGDKTMYTGVERQEEPAARLMLLGIQNKALPNALTTEGKTIIENAVKYLLKTNMEEVDDCSNYFTGAIDQAWEKDGNWFKGKAPNSPMMRVRILAPCEVSTTVHAAHIDIVTSGESSKKGGEMRGQLTIKPNGAVIVGGEVRAAEAPYFNKSDLKPTEEQDLKIETSADGQGALILNNDAGDTKATVEYYSLGRNDGGAYQFQYFASPMGYLEINPAFAGAGIYTYAWNEAVADGWERRAYYTDVLGFEGLAITTKRDYNSRYTLKGELASTADVDIPLTYTDAGARGQNLIGNSWTAPINIASLVEAFEDDANVDETVNIYNSGNDDYPGLGAAGTWTSVPISVAGWAEWEGLKVIPAMQAFRIDVTGETKLTMNYEKMVRETESSSLNEPLKAPSRRNNANGASLMRMRLESGNAYTDLFLIEGGQFSEAFDNGYEAKFIAGEDNTVQFYAMNGEEKMAVLATDALEGTPVGFVPGKGTAYTISFSGDGMGYYLNDVKKQTSTLISEENTYSFEYEEGDDANRFYISATPFEAPSAATGVTNLDAAAPKAQKIIYNDKLYIIRGGKVFSADGQLVK